ncbi:MAG: hypothetical protein LC725_11095, partial [Lentisphaerae bacterium]|nr:hypothetical protein [Lentisphaerota bacterium]
SEAVYVTRQGLLVRGSGWVEINRGDTRQANPLAQKHQRDRQHEQLAECRQNAAKQQAVLEALQIEQQSLDNVQRELRSALAERQQALARCEGELQLVEKQTSQVRQNIETVSWEFKELARQADSSEAKSRLLSEMDESHNRRQAIRVELETAHGQEAELEQNYRKLSAEVTAAEVRFAKQQEARVHVMARRQPLKDRLGALEKIIAERSARGASCSAEIKRAGDLLEQAARELPRLESAIAQHTEHLGKIQILREELQTTARGAEAALHRLRDEIETMRAREGELNGHCIEQRMQRQYLLERVTSEHRISADAIQLEPEPEWPEEGPPDLESLELTVAELHTKLESMGPVNTGAIEEYREQEERYEFLNRQQDDLLNSKQQLMELIKHINQTTTEMFATTFNAVNENFLSIFKQLFGGGTARLTLTDDEDILECGIEIIARPPGKKLQSVSLLSGGERTMTAVALLFAIYMVKPSPFCFLDELDAALDESNINRFIQVLQGFVQQSQFIVITHNRATISAADVLYGVTMEETGVSKIVSMRFVDNQAVPIDREQPAPAPA